MTGYCSKYFTDKSSHQNLLDFSDDDDDEVDCDPTPTSKPTVSNTNPSSKQIKQKKNTEMADTHQKNVNNNLEKKPFNKTSRRKVVLQSSDNENANSNNSSVKSHSTTNSRSRNPKKLKHSHKKIETSPSPSSSPASSSSSVVNSSRRSTRLSSDQKLNRRI